MMCRLLAPTVGVRTCTCTYTCNTGTGSALQEALGVSRLSVHGIVSSWFSRFTHTHAYTYWGLEHVHIARCTDDAAIAHIW